MIVQEINLYQDRFKEKVVPLSARQALTVLLLVLGILAYSSYWLSDRQQTVNAENQRLLQQKQQAEKSLEMIRARLESLLANNQVEVQINQLTRDITVRKHMINFVTNNEFGSGKGFSKRLEVLSKFSARDVWLSEIKLADNFMRFSGSALREENVPEYFNQLKKQEVFKGHKFDVFEMDRTKQHEWKVDFVIASRADSQ